MIFFYIQVNVSLLDIAQFFLEKYYHTTVLTANCAACVFTVTDYAIQTHFKTVSGRITSGFLGRNRLRVTGEGVVNRQPQPIFSNSPT